MMSTLYTESSKPKTEAFLKDKLQFHDKLLSLQMHNHSLLPRCTTLPTPKLNKQLVTDTFQQPLTQCMRLYV